VQLAWSAYWWEWYLSVKWQ